MHNSLLKERKATLAVGFSAKKDENRATGFVVGVVEPVPQIESVIAVRFIASLIMEEVDRHR